MEQPKDVKLPFFAYGVFKPGQLAFFQIKEFVIKAECARIKGTILLRDGLPILDISQREIAAEGSIIWFSPEHCEKAYKMISKMEPDNQYRWDKKNCNNQQVNVLIGRSPNKGTTCDDNPIQWDGWEDPLFTVALEVVEDTLNDDKNNSEFTLVDLRPLFRLQMAYSLLWSSIERYTSLRYHLGDDVTEKINNLASEQAFASSLKKNVEENREIYRADRPGDKEILDPDNPKKSINYYYQIRSNIAHRGKAAKKDYDTLQKSLNELLSIFRDVLKAAEQDAIYHSQ